MSIMYFLRWPLALLLSAATALIVSMMLGGVLFFGPIEMTLSFLILFALFTFFTVRTNRAPRRHKAASSASGPS